MVYYAEPRWPFILYGDGTLVQFRQKVFQKNEEGIHGWRFYIYPSDTVVRKYNIKQSQLLSQTGLMMQWYPASVVKVLSDDPITGKVFVMTDFLGNPTPFSQENDADRKIIESQQRQIHSMDSEVERLHQEMKKITSRYEQFFGDQARLREALLKKKTSDEEMGAEDFGE